MNIPTDNVDERQALAFEYVLGTLSKEEREAFSAQLRDNPALQQDVQYWEEALMPAPETVPHKTPHPKTLANIKRAINDTPHASPTKTPFWERLLPWKMVTGAAFALLVLTSTLLLYNPLFKNPTGVGPNVDYVAVLVDDAQKPVLTALTASDGSTLWLEWDNWQPLEADSSLQLWSESRRDGEVRPLMVFNRNQPNVALDEATWRLIKDSSHLIVTLEESGGSAIGEPSEDIIARGACIRLTAKPVDS